MQKDVYAIYEAYVVEGQGPYSRSATPPMPGAQQDISGEAGNNSRSPMPMGGKGINGAFGGPAGRDNFSSSTPPDSQSNEEKSGLTKEHKALVLKVKNLLELCHRADYEGIITDCMNISKLANAAKTAKEKKK